VHGDPTGAAQESLRAVYERFGRGELQSVGTVHVRARCAEKSLCRLQADVGGWYEGELRLEDSGQTPTEPTAMFRHGPRRDARCFLSAGDWSCQLPLDSQVIEQGVGLNPAMFLAMHASEAEQDKRAFKQRVKALNKQFKNLDGYFGLEVRAGRLVIVQVPGTG
jgi:hypothetical protein